MAFVNEIKIKKFNWGLRNKILSRKNVSLVWTVIKVNSYLIQLYYHEKMYILVFYKIGNAYEKGLKLRFKRFATSYKDIYFVDRKRIYILNI